MLLALKLLLIPRYPTLGQVEVNNPKSVVDDIRAELAPPKTEEELKPKEFARPAAPGRGRGRGRGRGPPPISRT